MNMKDLAELFKAVILLIWSGVGIIVVYLLFPSIKDLLNRDKINLKIGGMEISAENTVESLTKQVQDLQTKFLSLDAIVKKAPISSAGSKSTGALFIKRILWVDDNPSNNALQIDYLSKNGFQITTALSTREALLHLRSAKFGIIITDMSRDENSTQISDAGIKFIKEAKNLAGAAKFIIFTVSRSSLIYAEEAKEVGAYDITNSTVELYGMIDKIAVMGQ